MERSCDFAASGTTEGPNSITVINRGGWKVGGATDTYFQTGVAGDQMLGRFLSGLPYKSADFGALPPHFVGCQTLLASTLSAQHR